MIKRNKLYFGIPSSQNEFSSEVYTITEFTEYTKFIHKLQKKGNLIYAIYTYNKTTSFGDFFNVSIFQHFEYNLVFGVYFVQYIVILNIVFGFCVFKLYMGT